LRKEKSRVKKID